MKPWFVTDKCQLNHVDSGPTARFGSVKMAERVRDMLNGMDERPAKDKDWKKRRQVRAKLIHKLNVLIGQLEKTPGVEVKYACVSIEVDGMPVTYANR